MAIPELYRPLIASPPKFANLKSMCISSCIHSGAQVLFYGTLSQLPNDKIKFRTLLMPNVNFPEFMRQPAFKLCLQNIEHLKHLDIYGSKVSFPVDFIDSIKRAKDLEYLNLGASRVTEAQLSYIASHCQKLTSVNLFNCAEILQTSGNGLENLFKHCRGLKHLNISGEHHHLDRFGLNGSLVHAIKGLESLSVPTCMLVRVHQGCKRSATSCRCVEPPSKQLRLDSSPPSTNLRSSCHHDEPQPSTSTGYSSLRSSSAAACAFQCNTKSFLDDIVESNPELREFEILGVGLNSDIHQNRLLKPKVHKTHDPCHGSRQVTDSVLDPISRLTSLRALTLMGLSGVSTGTCLLSIASGCPCLRSLHVGYLGTNALQSLSTYSAFEKMTSLVDLRIEQPNLDLRRALFAAIAGCVQLQRLCIIAKNSSFPPDDVSHMVEKLTKLISLQMFAGNTATKCKGLVSALKHKYGRGRPAFSVVIFPLLHDSFATTVTTTSSAVPARHFDQLTRFSSRVATLSVDSARC